MTGTSGHDAGQAVLTFHEDRADFMKRAVPRLAVGTAGWCLLIVAGIWVKDHDAPLLLLLAGVACIWLVSLLIRFDIVALQFGRPIRYEIDGDQFRAYRGAKPVASFALSDVTEWFATSGANTWEYWVGWAPTRDGGFSSALGRYVFKVADPGSQKPRTIKPPALFRWEDRGGLEDVTRALIRRLGPPLNYSINYSLDD